MATSFGFNKPCKSYCVFLTIDHSKAFLKNVHGLLDYGRFGTSHDFPQLDTSAKAGCTFCGILRVSRQSHCSADGEKPFEGNVQMYKAKVTSMGEMEGE